MTHPAPSSGTPFSQLLSAMQWQDGVCHTELPADWLQGRTAYGGLSAALCLHATLQQHSDLPPLRSAQLCFIGPATGRLQISPQILRRGKSTVVVNVDLHGEAGLALRAILCFGASRSVTLSHVPHTVPCATAPEDAPPYYSFSPRPQFMAHFDGRLVSGSRPGALGNAPEMGVWLRHKDHGEDHALVRLMALADALPPAALVLYEQFIPISTMTWSIDFLHPEPHTQDGWWLAQTVAESSEAGYSTQGTLISNRAGQPVLLARQNIAIFG
jgi:acyl-CoA thioesterase